MCPLFPWQVSSRPPHPSWVLTFTDFFENLPPNHPLFPRVAVFLGHFLQLHASPPFIYQELGNLAPHVFSAHILASGSSAPLPLLAKNPPFFIFSHFPSICIWAPFPRVPTLPCAVFVVYWHLLISNLSGIYSTNCPPCP